jgi:hypothetical protein
VIHARTRGGRSARLYVTRMESRGSPVTRCQRSTLKEQGMSEKTFVAIGIAAGLIAALVIIAVSIHLAIGCDLAMGDMLAC